MLLCQVRGAFALQDTNYEPQYIFFVAGRPGQVWISRC